MQQTEINKEISYHLDKGYLYFTERPAVVGAVVGSCACVCIWDKYRMCGGMSHYIYPYTTDKSRATPEFGNVATRTLIRMFRETNSAAEDLQAHIIGGGSPEHDTTDLIGKKNIDVARNILRKENIRIVSEDVSGTMGRKILFDLGTGQIAVFKVHHIRKQDWV